MKMSCIGQAKACCCALKLVADAENSPLWGGRPDPNIHHVIWALFFKAIGGLTSNFWSDLGNMMTQNDIFFRGSKFRDTLTYFTEQLDGNPNSINIHVLDEI